MSVAICSSAFSRKSANRLVKLSPHIVLQYFTFLVYLLLLAACDDSKQSQSPSAPKSSQKSLLESKIHQTKQTPVNIWENSGYEQTDTKMELKKVSAHVYYVEGPPGAPSDNNGFMSNASVVIGDTEVVVFDTLGTPSLGYLLLNKIKQITNKPIRKVIVSHYHADHIYGIQVFKDIGAQVIAPIGAKLYINSPAAKGRLSERRESLFPWVNDSTRIVKPDRYISKNENINIDGVTLKLVSLGSTHSDGDMMVYVYPDNVLLAGDLMFEGRIPYIAGSNPGRWLKHVTELDPMKFNIIVPGHGPASSDPKSAVSFTKDYLNYLHISMMKAVEELIPFDEAYQSVNWDKYKDSPAFQVNRMNAYYVFLDLESASVK